MTTDIKKTVLVVEDEKALRNILEEKLEKEGFSVLTANDGKKGLGVALKNKPDFILLDILMPAMNGVEMMRRLRQNDWGKTVPILLLTNNTDPEDMRETLKNNAVDYLVKADWDLDSVVKMIKTKLGLL
jgi:two-component system alkaline phosphatase synthesis response regulator PhoP